MVLPIILVILWVLVSAKNTLLVLEWVLDLFLADRIRLICCRLWYRTKEPVQSLLPTRFRSQLLLTVSWNLTVQFASNGIHPHVRNLPIIVISFKYLVLILKLFDICSRTEHFIHFADNYYYVYIFIRFESRQSI